MDDESPQLQFNLIQACAMVLADYSKFQ